MDSMATKNQHRNATTSEKSKAASEAQLKAKNDAFLRNQYKNRCKCGRVANVAFCANCYCFSKRNAQFGGI